MNASNYENKIIDLLSESSGLRAKEISSKLGIEKKNVNRILYGNIKEQVRQDNNYKWFLNDSSTSSLEINNAVKNTHSFVTKYKSLLKKKSARLQPKESLSFLGSFKRAKQEQKVVVEKAKEFLVKTEKQEVDEKEKKAFHNIDLSRLRKEAVNIPITSLMKLSKRPRNCLIAEKIVTFGQLFAMTKNDLMRIPSFGRRSFVELHDKLLELNASKQPINEVKAKESLAKDEKEKKAIEEIAKESLIKAEKEKKAFHNIDLSRLRKEAVNIPITSLMKLSVRATNCLIAEKIVTFGQLFAMTKNDLMRIPDFGRHSFVELHDKLLELNASKQPINEVNYVIDNTNLENYILSIKSHFNDRQFEILSVRIGLERKPETLIKTGQIYNVTRERIRQIEARAITNIMFIDLAKIIEQKLFNIRKNLSIPLYVNQISIYDDFFAPLESKPWILKEILQKSKEASHNVENIDGKLIVTIGKNNALANFIDYLKRHLEEQIGENYSKKDLRDHINVRFPLMAKEITTFLFSKLNNYKFTENVDESKSMLVTSGHGNFYKIVAILESSDRPLSREELYKKCGSISSKRYFFTHLTQNGIYNFARSRYGTRKHLSFNENEIKLINETTKYHMLQDHRDRQWSTEELIKKATFANRIQQNINKHTLAICMRQSSEFNFLGQFIFILAGSSNTKIQKKNLNNMVLDILEKSSKPLSTRELKSIIKKERAINFTTQIHANGKLIPIREFPINRKKNKWGLIDKHLNVSKKQLIKIVLEMQNLIKKNGGILTPEQCIKAIKENDILYDFQDKVLTLFLLADKSIYFIEKKHILYHVDADIPNLSQEDCLKIVASKINSKGIKKDALIDQVKSLYGGDIPYNIPSKLYRYGFTFSENTNDWHKGELVGY